MRFFSAKNANPRKGRSRFWLLACCLVLFAVCIGAAMPARAWDPRTVRVGYVPTEGVAMEKDGRMEGYLVDYLDALVPYTGWEIEYVSDTWSNNVQKLISGKVDLLGLVRHTDDREGYFLYSELSMAHDYTALCAAADSDIYYQDYSAFEGCRVGVVKSSIHENAFVEYAEAQDLDYEIISFDTEEQAQAALTMGNIELLATGGFTSHTGMRLVDRFRLERTHLVTGTHNHKLMAELNSAAQQARTENANLEAELYEKHFGGDTDMGLLLTREEQAYIDSVGPIVVKGFVGRQPLGYVDNTGEYVGMLVDYLNMLGNVSGLEFVHEKVDFMSLDRSLTTEDGQGYALLYGQMDLMKDRAVLRSEPLFEADLVCVRRQDSGEAEQPDDVIAVNTAQRYVAEMLLEQDPLYEIRYYDDSTACMEAVVDGEADMTIQDEHVVAYLLQKPKYADLLTQTSVGDYVDALCLYAPESHAMLISIINKTLDYLGEERMLNSLANLTLSYSYSYGVEDFLYEYIGWIIGFVGLLLLILVLLATLYFWRVNIRVQKRENEDLQARVQLDELTGVYNRSHFFIRARELLDRVDEPMCIVRVNISNFKIINELHGAKKGDDLLQGVAKYLMGLGQQAELLVGRFNSDHFYLCMRQADFERLPLQRQFSTLLPGVDVNITYGVYYIGDQKDVPVNIMCDRADMANAARGASIMEYIRYYSDEERQRLIRDQEIESEQEWALSEGQFRIFIQPKYDLSSGEIVGGEALVRWFHPEKGMIPPGEFIGLFERNGFIRQLDYFVWEACCRFLAEAEKKGLRQLPISTNVSRVHFYGSGLQSKLMKLLDTYGIAPRLLELEITETICADDPEVIFDKCRQLRKAGFKIAMDDFGSGYSSLNMLKEMPLDIIKMDLRFLSGGEGEEQERKGRDILRTLIELGHHLELQVVVEGLETQAQKDFVERVGRCVGQGYFYSRPIDTDSFEALIRE